MSVPSSAVSGPVTLILSWFWRLATLTGTWWLQTLAGGVILGVGPATLTLHRRIMSDLDADDDGGMRGAWRSWRAGFWDAQRRIGVPLLTVVVLTWYLLAFRGTPFAVSIAVLGVVYLIWLIHLPAVAVASEQAGTGSPTACWVLTARLVAANAVPCTLAALAALAVLGALLMWFPGGLVLAVPVVPALAGTLATRRALARRESADSAAHARVVE